MDIKTARAVLGVELGASRREVKRAYRKKARELHPDAGGEAADFRELQEAFITLENLPLYLLELGEIDFSGRFHGRWEPIPESDQVLCVQDLGTEWRVSRWKKDPLRCQQTESDESLWLALAASLRVFGLSEVLYTERVMEALIRPTDHWPTFELAEPAAALEGSAPPDRD
jgi:curved DNA-binding protein CbpA